MAREDRSDRLDHELVFIVGMPRSGTTWVYDLLSAHPDASGVFESWVMSRQYGLGALFDPVHWTPNRDGNPRGLAQLVGRDEVVRAVRELALRLFGADKRFLIEKTPSHLYSLDLIAEVFPDARVIHVLRDGRDVAVSVKAAAGSFAPEWRATISRSVAASATAWRDAVERARAHAAPLGDRFTEVRYEELQAEPLDAAAGLFDFCGMHWDQDLLERVVAANRFGSSFQGGEDQFRRSGRSGEWRERFSMLDRFRFDRAAGETLVATGYEQRRRWWFRMEADRCAYPS